VIYVDPDDVDEMHRALLDVQIAAKRSDLAARGLQQANLFSWSRMSREVGQRLATWCVDTPEHRP
jgi:hypothetical protein